MPKPQTKQELLQAIDVERTKLNQAFEELTEVEMGQPGACAAWSVKDILAHQVDWEQRGLGWYRDGLRGKVPKPPDEKYNWRQLPALNHEIYLKYKDLSVQEVLEKYNESFNETMAAINAMSEEELFTPNTYTWTGKHLLGTYVNANTASHYRWASKLIWKFARHIKA